MHSVDVECGREYICEVWRGKRWRNKEGIEWLGMGLVLIKRNIICNLKIKHSQTIKNVFWKEWGAGTLEGAGGGADTVEQSGGCQGIGRSQGSHAGKRPHFTTTSHRQFCLVLGRHPTLRTPHPHPMQSLCLCRNTRVNPTAEATHPLCNNLQFPKRELEGCDGWHFLLPCGMSGKDMPAWQC